MSLNSHQRAYVEYLHAQPLSDLCWCGWYAKDECGSWCSKSGKGLTAADKAKEACAECGNTPWEPGLPVTHNIKCPKHVRGDARADNARRHRPGRDFGER